MIKFRKQASYSDVFDGGKLIGYLQFITPGRYYATTPVGSNVPMWYATRKGEAVDYLINMARA